MIDDITSNRMSVQPNRVVRYSDWDLGELTSSLTEWVQQANREGIDVQKQVGKVARVAVDAPVPSGNVNNNRELVLVQQIFMRRLYCNQVIRKITKHRIRRTAKEGKMVLLSAMAMDILKSKSAQQQGPVDPSITSLIDLINGSERWLFTKLPPKLCLGSHKSVEDRFLAIENELHRMRYSVKTKIDKVIASR